MHGNSLLAIESPGLALHSGFNSESTIDMLLLMYIHLIRYGAGASFNSSFKPSLHDSHVLVNPQYSVSSPTSKSDLLVDESLHAKFRRHDFFEYI